METIKNFVRYTSWPLLVVSCLLITAYGMAVGSPVLYFNFAYLFLIVILFFLEWWLPYEPEWKNPDGQTFANIAHTISSKGTVQLLLLWGGVIGLSEYMKPVADAHAYGIWPRSWLLGLQVIIGLYVMEFGLYWAHRFGHLNALFWRFHSIHHSVTRLWFVNTGRFHFMDSLFKISLSLPLLLILGAPMEVIQWVSAVTAFIGLLTHCNVNMRLGPLNYVFSTPQIHRWHHSKRLSEGNRNFGENLVFWDQVFGTYINPLDRRPPVKIGITDHMPPKFLHQIVWPFLTVKARQRLAPEYVYKPFMREPKRK